MNADTIARMQRSLLAIRTAAVRIQKQHHDLFDVVNEIHEAVHEIERELLAAVGELVVESPAARGRRTATKAKEYYIEKVGGVETISERRLDSPYPFRAPCDVLNAVVDALAKSDEPLSFHQVRRQVADRLGNMPREYAVRLCLRFLGQDGAGLVQHARTRFAAVDRGKVRAAAKAALARLSGSR